MAAAAVLRGGRVSEQCWAEPCRGCGIGTLSAVDEKPPGAEMSLPILTLFSSPDTSSRNGGQHHDVSVIGTGSSPRRSCGKIAMTRMRPRRQTGQRSMSIPVNRSMIERTDSVVVFFAPGG